MAEIAFNTQLPIVDSEGRPTPVFAAWMTIVSRLSPLSGDGPPENNVEGSLHQFYWDTTGNALYFKESADIAKDPKRGWVIV